MGNRGANGPDRLVAKLAASEWGVLSIDELRACGLSRDAVAARSRRGTLHRLHRGVYAVGHANPPLEGLLLAAVKACRPRGVLSDFAAAAMWNYVAWEEGRYPEITLQGPSTRRHPGIGVHRTIALEPVDLRCHKGIRLTAPARTIIAIAPRLSDRALRRVIRSAQGERVVSFEQLYKAVGRLHGFPGASRVASHLATGSAPTRSELEDVVLDLILRGGLVRPDVNRPLIVAGRRLVPDFRWPHQRLIVEADGARWHDGEIARVDDAERQALLESAGEWVVRVSWHQAVVMQRQTLSRLRAAGAPDRDPLAS